MRAILAKLRLKAEADADQLPDLLMRAHQVANSSFSGEHLSQQSGAGEKFWQFRHYTTQDRPQDIDWRQSGKSDAVFIRQKQKQQLQSIYFWCNRDPSMEYTSSTRRPKKSEAAHILILALGIMMQRAGEHIGMMGHPKTGRGSDVLNDIGQALLSAAPVALKDVPTTSHGRNHASLVMVSDFIDEHAAIDARFRQLSGRYAHGLIIQVLDPAEMDLPWRGRIIFEDIATTARENIQNVTSIREAYRQKIQDHMAAIQSTCDDIGWTYVLHRTDQPYTQTLEKIYEQSLARAL